MSVILIPEGIMGFVGKETGVGVALRENGEELLFVTKGNDGEGGPLRWIKIGDFHTDAKDIVSVDDEEPPFE